MATLTKYPTANTATTGFNGVANSPTDAYTDNTVYANFAPSKPRNDENAHSWRGFDFSTIPAGSTINSVTVKVQEYMSASNTSGEWRVALFEDVTSAGALAPGVTTAIGGVQYTRATTDTSEFEWDLGTLSTEPTLAQLQATNFGVRIEVAHGNTGTAYTYYVDTIEITVDYTEAAAAATQRWFCFYEDSVENAGDTARHGAVNRGKALADDTVYLLRMGMSASGAVSVTPKLQYRIRTTAAGAYGSWADVNATSSYVRSAATANIADDAQTTEQLDDSGTFTAGRFDEVDGAITTATSLTATTDTEFLFAIKVRSAELSWRNIVQLRMVNASDGAAYDTYDLYPTLSLAGSIEEDFENGTDLANIQALNDTTPNTNFDDVNLGEGFIFTDTVTPPHGSLAAYGTSDPTLSGNAEWADVLCPELFLRMYVYKSATPTANTAIARFYNTAGVARNAIRWLPDGTLNFQEADTTNNSAGSPSTGQWIRIEARWVAAASADHTDSILELKYWNTPDSTGTPDGTVTVDPALGADELGKFWLRFEGTEDWYFDEVSIANDDWIGPAVDYDGPVVRGTTSGTVSSSTSIDVDLDASSAVAGDLAIVHIAGSSAAVGINESTGVPSGWTKIYQFLVVTDFYESAWYKVLTQTDIDNSPASFDSITESQHWAYQLDIIQAGTFDAAAPIDATDFDDVNSITADMEITTTEANCLLLYYAAEDAAATGWTFSADWGQENLDAEFSTTFLHLGGYEDEAKTAGTYSRTITTTDAAGDVGGIMVAVAPSTSALFDESGRAALIDFATASSDTQVFVESLAALLEVTGASSDVTDMPETLLADVALATAVSDVIAATFNESLAALFDVATAVTDVADMSESLSAEVVYAAAVSDALYEVWVEALSAALDLSTASSDAAEFVESVAAAVDFASAVVDELGRVWLENLDAAVDLATTLADVQEFSDSLAADVEFTSASTDAQEMVDSLVALVEFVTDIVDTLVPGGGETWTENLAALLDLATALSDVADLPEALSADVALAAASSDVADMAEALSADVDLSAASSDVAEMSEALGADVDLSSAVADALFQVWVEALGADLSLATVGTELHDMLDSLVSDVSFGTTGYDWIDDGSPPPAGGVRGVDVRMRRRPRPDRRSQE